MVKGAWVAQWMRPLPSAQVFSDFTAFPWLIAHSMKDKIMLSVPPTHFRQ